MGRHSARRPAKPVARVGASSIDYVLVLAVMIPLATFMFTVVPRMIRLVYEMTVTMVGSPLM